MSFRLRPSSKRSTDTEHSLVEFPKQQQVFMSNDTMSLKQLANKIQLIESSLNNISENARKDREISNAGYIEVQRRLDTLDYKSFANEKDIKLIQDINKNNFSPLPPISRKEDHGASISKNEVALLKQTLLQERQSQKEQLKHVSSMMEQMSMKQLRLEQELREALNRSNEEHQARIADQTGEIRKFDEMKSRKLDQQYELIKENMASVERRIYEELEAKMRKETILKEFIMEKVNEAKEEISREQKQQITNETRLTRETKQSLESLFSMVNDLKSSFSDQLSQTQTLSINNLKRLSMNLDMVGESLSEKIKVIKEDVSQNSKQILDFRQWVVGKLDENREVIMGLQEEVLEGATQTGKGRNGISRANDDEGEDSQMSEKFSLLQKDLNQWKSITEQKNLTIFKEISQTIKHMKIEFKKENDQVSSELISLTESLKAMKRSLPSEMKKVSQSIVTIFNDEFDVLAEELDLITEMIKVSKVETEKSCREEVRKSREELYAEIKAMVQSSKKDALIVQDKSLLKSEEGVKASIQKESSYIQALLSQKIEAIQNTQRELEANSKKLNLSTNSQLESFTLSMKQFNENYKDYLDEQRKDDLKKRIELEESMRKNASNLMEVSYKKSEFLVEGMKNAIEMNQMKEKLTTKQQIESIRDQVNKNSLAEKDNLHEAIKSLTEKLSSERQASETALEESLTENINSVKRSVGIEMGNSKLEIEEKISESQAVMDEKLAQASEEVKALNEAIEEFKKKEELEREKLKKGQQEGILAAIHELEVSIDTTDKKLSGDLKHESEQTKAEIEKVRGELSLLKEQGKSSEAKLAEKSQKESEQMAKELQELKTKVKQVEEDIKKQSEKAALLSEENNKLCSEKQKLKNQSEQEKIQNQKNGQMQIEMMEEQTKRMQLAEEQLKREVGNQMAQLTQKQEDTLKELEETVGSLRESVWKMEAMGFSEQAKNKALFDKVNADMARVQSNLQSIAKQISVELDKKK